MGEDWDVQTADGSVMLTLPGRVQRGARRRDARRLGARQLIRRCSDEKRARREDREERRRTLKATLGRAARRSASAPATDRFGSNELRSGPPSRRRWLSGRDRGREPRPSLPAGRSRKACRVPRRSARRQSRNAPRQKRTPPRAPSPNRPASRRPAPRDSRLSPAAQSCGIRLAAVRAVAADDLREVRRQPERVENPPRSRQRLVGQDRQAAPGARPAAAFLRRRRTARWSRAGGDRRSPGTVPARRRRLGIDAGGGQCAPHQEAGAVADHHRRLRRGRAAGRRDSSPARSPTPRDRRPNRSACRRGRRPMCRSSRAVTLLDRWQTTSASPRP